MPADDPVHELTLAWLKHAETDLLAATMLLADADDLAPTIAFHGQQAIEKTLKAVLVSEQIHERVSDGLRARGLLGRSDEASADGPTKEPSGRDPH